MVDPKKIRVGSILSYFNKTRIEVYLVSKINGEQVTYLFFCSDSQEVKEIDWVQRKNFCFDGCSFLVE